jgi:ATP-dependent helicase YprA (DUF1998 family)
MEDVLGIFSRMKEMYIRYMDSPFALGHEKLAAERRALLDKEGIIYQYPYIEALPPFISSNKRLEDVCEAINWPKDFADFASKGLFDKRLYLHNHQYEAFKNVLGNHKNIVVTSGTGSGKTESFLLPLIANIINESRKWDAPEPQNSPWWEKGNKWILQRAFEKRTAAIRGLILYPLNALVEDQLVRLRKALDSDDARRWLDSNRKGNRIYFGRYTGKTPVPGDPTNNSKVKKLKQAMKQMMSKQHQLRQYFDNLQQNIISTPDSITRQQVYLELQDELDLSTLNASIWTDSQIEEIKVKLKSKLHDKLAFLNKVDGAEMNSRWDMQHSPPDILITNFSMLNIILTRQIEQQMFEKTKKWLEEDPSHTFFLILDELHAYRGTAGTEVSYVLRSLLDRLGLSPESPQLRVLATSASIDEDGESFLEDFFGIPIDKFEIIPGERESSSIYPQSTSFINNKNSFSKFYDISINSKDEIAGIRFLCEAFGVSVDESHPYQSLFEVLKLSGALNSFIVNCQKPKSLKELSKSLFNDDSDLNAIGGLLYAIVKAKNNNNVVLPLRAHLFFRNFQGLWSCSNPDCSAVEEQYKFEGRVIGKLYSQPRVQCTCGSRVLDLYYCQNCGDIFLGGYKTLDRTNENVSEYYLSADFPDLETLPDKLPPTKKYGQYALYWPSLNLDPEAKSWKRSLSKESNEAEDKNKNKLEFSWEKANFNHKLGKIRSDNFDATGHWFQIKGKETAVNKMPAFPIYCPHCADNWELQGSGHPLESTKKTRSPIRGQRTGFDMIAQVMLDALMRELTEKERPKAVLFSDSRQDAAKLSAKLEQNHYYHLLRYIVVQVVRLQKAPIRSFIKKVKGETLSEEEYQLANQYWSENFNLASIIENYIKGSPLPPNLIGQAKEMLDSASKPPKLGDLWDEVELNILKLGINPGGPDNSLRTYMGIPWTSLYNWNDITTPGINSNLSLDQREFRKEIRKMMKENVITNVLFSQRKRDLESLSLAMITTDIEKSFGSDLGKDESFWRQLVDSSVRILGGLRRYDNNRSPSDNPPPQLKKYWKAVANAHSIKESDLLDKATRIFQGLKGVKQYLLQSDEIYVVPASHTVYSCQKCHRDHLHPSCGVCTDCYSELKERTIGNVYDYYRFLAEDVKTARRFHSEEMTGQTDPEDALKRQQLFQAIYDIDDIPLVDEIDILSVTTTMEAGVDIGSLRIVAMSNMPPQRFNYQQRVGRCGRRGSALSVSLTLCRGRSHDDWYFDNLDRMTGDPPPQPYIDLKSKKIFSRVLNKEMLFYAFQETGLNQEVSGGESVHGEFGDRMEWNNYKDRIQSYLSSNDGLVRVNQVVKALSHKTKLSKEDIQDLVNYVTQGNLVQDITRIAADPKYSSNSLSENLAAAGLLPMFGFPTRVRLLHHAKRNQHSTPQDLEKDTIDRDLEIAINEYSPGSEVVKDKVKHRSVGIVHYWTMRNRVIAEKNPLGNIRTIALCKSCHVLYDDKDSLPNECPSCGALLDSETGTFKSVRLSEPQGFRSEWLERDFKEEFEWTSRSSVPRLAHDGSQFTQLEKKEVYNTSFWSQEGDVYSINDNNDELFTFVKARNDYDGWIEINRIGVNGFNPLVTDQKEKVALASIKNTEVLILSPLKVNTGITFQPTALGVRAGLISFGFLFRRIATNILDVDADELQVGIRPFLDSKHNNLVGQLFFADRLINGAGYSKYLAQEKILKQIFDDMTGQFNYIPKLRDHQCDSSCYECLRTYENMGYHGILDWRLGLDVAQLLKNPNYIPKIDDKWLNLVTISLKNIVENYEGIEECWYSGVPGVKLPFPGQEVTILFGHPFWNVKNEDYFIEQLSDATVEAQSESTNGIVMYYDIFDLIRRPTWVIQNVIERMNE